MEQEELTQKIIRAFYDVHDELGSGFLESVYENALVISLEEKNLRIEKQKSLNVYFHNQCVGEFRADIIVENAIIIELKACSKLSGIHQAQVINYLKATGLPIGLLVNFGDKLEFKRLHNKSPL